MSQTSLNYPASPLAGADFVADTEAKLEALASNRSGASVPDDVQENEIWVQQTDESEARTVYIHNSGSDVKIGTVENSKFSGDLQIASSINDTGENAVPSAAMMLDAIEDAVVEATISASGTVFLASGAGDQRANAVPSVTMAAGLGMPSTKYIDFSGSSYVAPNNGYIDVNLTNNTNTAFLSLGISNSISIVSHGGNAPNLSVVIQIAAGQTVNILYAGGNINQQRFYYAQGAN